MALPKLVLYRSLPPSGARNVTWAQWQRAMERTQSNFMRDIVRLMDQLYNKLPVSTTFDHPLVSEQLEPDPVIAQLRENFRWLPVTLRPITMGVDDLVIIALNFAEAKFLVDPTPAQLVYQQHIRSSEPPITADASLTRLGQIRRALTLQRPTE